MEVEQEKPRLTTTTAAYPTYASRDRRYVRASTQSEASEVLESASRHVSDVNNDKDESASPEGGKRRMHALEEIRLTPDRTNMSTREDEEESLITLFMPWLAVFAMGILFSKLVSRPTRAYGHSPHHDGERPSGAYDYQEESRERRENTNSTRVRDTNSRVRDTNARRHTGPEGSYPTSDKKCSSQRGSVFSPTEASPLSPNP